MASNWFYKQDDQEQGPCTFRDLVEMVREEQLVADDLVRPHYMREWQRADSIVGLFHMARRDPSTLPPVEKTVEEQELEWEEMAEQAESAFAKEVEKPGWLKRLLSLRSSKIPAVPVDPRREVNDDFTQPAPDPLEDSNDLDADYPVGTAEINGVGIEADSNSTDEVTTGAYSDDTWSSAIDAAVDRIDERAPKPEEESVPIQIIPPRAFSFLYSPLFHKILKTIAFVVCVSLGIYGFVNWIGQGTLVFPFIGACSPLMFLVYSATALVGVALLGFLLLYISSSYLRIGFRIGSAIVTASITAYFILNWSERTYVIFPTRNTIPTEPKLSFPLMGECSSFAYWMYFADTIIVVAVLTFFVAWWLEARAEDV